MRPRDQLRKWDTQQDAVFSLTLLQQTLTAGMSLDFNQMGILNQGVPFQYVVKLITQPEVKVHGVRDPLGLKANTGRNVNYLRKKGKMANYENS